MRGGEGGETERTNERKNEENKTCSSTDTEQRRFRYDGKVNAQKHCEEDDEKGKEMKLCYLVGAREEEGERERQKWETQ